MGGGIEVVSELGKGASRCATLDEDSNYLNGLKHILCNRIYIAFRFYMRVTVETSLKPVKEHPALTHRISVRDEHRGRVLVVEGVLDVLGFYN